IGEAALDDQIGMRIIAVRRAKKWYYNPPDSFRLKEKDTLIARGFLQGREALSQLAKEGVCES
ncbi:MAG: potassium channel protein, partial [Candidatus Altiarchaeales archaeon ex4484_2]